MSRIVYFDCASGASGDMLLGALVDLGLPLDALKAELAKIPLQGYRLEAHKVHRAGLQATKVDVLIADHPAEHGHPHSPSHRHGGHGHDHGHDPGHEAVHAHAPAHDHGHAHRGLRDILALVDRSKLDPSVKERVSGLFGRTWTHEGRSTPLKGSLDVAAFLLEQARVAVVPGLDFGSDAHVRLSYATSDALISEGLARMGAAIKTLG